jgi:hypothetical protein
MVHTIRTAPQVSAQRDRWFTLASGLSVLLMMGVAFLVANVLPTEGFPPAGGYPSPFASSIDIERFFSENPTIVRTLGAVLALLAVAMAAFVVSITGLLRTHESDDDVLVRFAYATGLLASGFVMISAILTWVLSRPVVVEETPALRTVHDLTFLAGGPAHVLFVAAFLAAASMSASRSRAFPRWLMWLGMVGAAVSSLAIVALVWRPATYILPASRAFLGAWILGACLLLLVGPRSHRVLASKDASPQPRHRTRLAS